MKQYCRKEAQIQSSITVKRLKYKHNAEQAEQETSYNKQDKLQTSIMINKQKCKQALQ